MYSSRSPAEGVAVGGGQPQFGIARQGAGRLDPHLAHRIAQQRRQGIEPRGGVGAGQCPDGGGAHRRIGVEAGLASFRRGRACGRARSAGRSRSPSRSRVASGRRRCGRASSRWPTDRRGRPPAKASPKVWKLAGAWPVRARISPAAQAAGFVGVAESCRRRTADGGRKIGPRDAEAVVVARIDDHVGHRRHVAGDALAGLGAGRVEEMLRAVEAGRLMALAAQRVATRPAASGCAARGNCCRSRPWRTCGSAGTSRD